MIANVAFGQVPEGIYFRSAFEKQQFEKVLNNEADPTALLIGFSDEETDYEMVKTRLQQFYALVETQNLRKKSDKQFAKALFTSVHDYFLRKYEDNAAFNLIFRKGYYNCVSASALFATILDHYDIPYKIKEVPTHVYLVAYPDTHNILYETTSPNGFYAPDVKAKERYLHEMVRSKLTTEEYVQRLGYSKAFEELYYAKDNVDLIQLASFQYSNQALFLSREKKEEEAIHYIIKAHKLNPSVKHEFLKLNMIGSYLANSQMNGKWDVMYLIELGNTSRDENLKREVSGNFQNYLYQKLIKNSNDSALVATYNLLNSNIKDTTLRAEITHYYNVGLMQWYSVKGKMDESLKYAGLAYKYKPGDITIQENVVNLIMKKAARTAGNSSNLQELDDYKATFQFLDDNLYFLSLYATNYGYMAIRSFQSDQYTEGYKYMKLLIDEVEEHGSDLMMGEDLIAFVFAEAGAYHFRLKQYDLATEIMQKGFKYAPDNGELKVRLQIVKDEIK